MLIEAALAMEIHRTNQTLPDETLQQYAQWVVEEAKAREIDPWIFHAVIHTETRWKAGVVVREHDGSCSVGLGGINVKCDTARMQDLRKPEKNIQAMGSFLAGIRKRCRYHCDGLGWLQYYNYGDRDYVPKKVGPIVEHCHVAYQSVVHEVRVGVLPPGVRREEDN